MQAKTIAPETRFFYSYLNAGSKEYGGDMAGRLCTVRETAAQLGLSTKTVWKMIYARELTCTRIRRAVRVPETAISELIEASTVPAKVA
jgi:excisionase family DNA binding protein